MKKRMILILLALLLLLSSCGAATISLPETELESETRAASVPPATTKPITYPVISEPLTLADVQAIPVATSDMTEEELRQICVSYMKLMTSVVWTPDGDLSYSYPSAFTADENGLLHLEAGKLYGGVPYTQAAANLESFFDYYDETNGVVEVAGVGDAIHKRIGNNCGTAVFWAWQRISSTIDYYGTRQMCLAHGCIPVGSYTYDESLPDFYTRCSTKMVCEENGENVMMASYALLKPGDGVTMTVKGTGGHARMVEENHPSYRADGTVDSENSYVICLEQASHGPNRETEDGMVVGIGSENRYSYKDLYQKSYLPVTIAELCGKATVKEATASVTDFETLKELPTAKITASYCISRLDVTLTDESGKVAFTDFKTGSCKTGEQYTMSLGKVLPAVALSRSVEKGKTYTVTVTARLGNGETLTALTKTVSY